MLATDELTPKMILSRRYELSGPVLRITHSERLYCFWIVFFYSVYYAFIIEMQVRL